MRLLAAGPTPDTRFTPFPPTALRTHASSAGREDIAHRLTQAGSREVCREQRGERPAAKAQTRQAPRSEERTVAVICPKLRIGMNEFFCGGAGTRRGPVLRVVPPAPAPHRIRSPCHPAPTTSRGHQPFSELRAVHRQRAVATPQAAPPPPPPRPGQALWVRAQAACCSRRQRQAPPRGHASATRAARCGAVGSAPPAPRLPERGPV